MQNAPEMLRADALISRLLSRIEADVDHPRLMPPRQHYHHYGDVFARFIDRRHYASQPVGYHVPAYDYFFRRLSKVHATASAAIASRMSPPSIYFSSAHITNLILRFYASFFTLGFVMTYADFT